MRVTSHNGRFGSVKHNARGFDLDHADHIDQARVADNQYWFWDQANMEPEDIIGAEERYYHMKFGDALDAQNERYRAKSQYGRIKTMGDWMEAKNTRPEETIWQIGDMTEDVDPEDFTEAVGELQEWLMEWSEAHGSPFQVLDTAVHLDESSPHAHSRRVWQYQDTDGTWRIGQNKALEAAGVPLPDPSKPEGPKNNRKMTFDVMVRDKWVEICEAHGYEVEREPDPKHQTHLPKAQIIELHEREAELDERAIKIRTREADVGVREKKADRREAELNRRERALEAQEQAQEVQAGKIQAGARKALELLQEAQDTLSECKRYKQREARELQARIVDRAAAAQAMLDRVGGQGTLQGSEDVLSKG